MAKWTLLIITRITHRKIRRKAVQREQGQSIWEVHVTSILCYIAIDLLLATMEDDDSIPIKHKPGKCNSVNGSTCGKMASVLRLRYCQRTRWLKAHFGGTKKDPIFYHLLGTS